MVSPEPNPTAYLGTAGLGYIRYKYWEIDEKMNVSSPCFLSGILISSICEIPLLSKTYFESDATHLAIATKAIHDVFENKSLHDVIDAEDLMEFNISQPKLFVGDIASGDQFFSSNEQKHGLNTRLPDVLCVEMEGAAVAQVCYEYEVPFSIIRTISDVADDQSHIDFPSFIKKISSKYSAEIIKNIYKQL